MAGMRRTAEFIPYRFIDGQWCLFVQKRTKDAPLAADMFGIFGGHLEDGESPETALFREILEELDYHPWNARFFRKYEYIDCEQYVFVTEVDEGFENEIKVLEGEYGAFFSESDLNSEKVIEFDKAVFHDVFRWLEGSQ
jgi:8-oxo-dGTP pyrophosphatase MutT (NUDIX family)